MPGDLPQDTAAAASPVVGAAATGKIVVTRADIAVHDEGIRTADVTRIGVMRGGDGVFGSGSPNDDAVDGGVPNSGLAEAERSG